MYVYNPTCGVASIHNLECLAGPAIFVLYMQYRRSPHEVQLYARCLARLRFLIFKDILFVCVI